MREHADLGLELGHGAGGRGLVEHLLLCRLHFVVGGVLQVFDIVGVEHPPLEHRRGRDAVLLGLQLAQALLEPLPAALERLVDGLGRRGQAPLQDGQRKTHRARALVVLQGLGAVELLADVAGDLAVELLFGRRQLVADRVGHALGEQRRAVELDEALLDHATHQVHHVDLVHAVAEAALEAVAVEQCEEELEVLLLAVVRRGRHQQQVTRQTAQQLREPVAPGVLDLAAEEGGRELVRLVEHDQVPAGLGGLELGLHVLVARQLVQPGDDQRRLGEPVAGAGGLQLVIGEDVERELEPAPQLVLPLLGKAAGAHDQASLQVAAGDKLLDEQARHDGLARPGVVGEQEAQGLPRQHGLVHRSDLVRQRVDQRRVDGQQRVEQVGQANPVGLGDETEQAAVAVEAPRAPGGDDLQPGLVVAVDEFVAKPALGGLVGQLQALGAEPLRIDDSDDRTGQDAAHA